MKVGLIGWRGMVGSVLMARMIANNDFTTFSPVFFSTSQAGQPLPDSLQKAIPAGSTQILHDANDIHSLAGMDAIISCQGGEYTTQVHAPLRHLGWQGYWIDAASTLRMMDQAVIILDPVNQPVIQTALAQGKRDFIGGNCTVSLMLMALIGLIRTGEVEWISSMTYQAASGAGAKHMRELLLQMGVLHDSVAHELKQGDGAILEVDAKVSQMLRSNSLPTEQFGHPLAANVLPWIDKELPNGQSKEEWKGEAEANKILGNTTEHRLPIDGLCVRVGALRAHSQALTIKMKRPMTPQAAEKHIVGVHEWLRFVPNHKEESLALLNPASVSGTLEVAIGRLRQMTLGKEYLTCFTVGDQLLWGAAEPLRRMLRIVQANA